MRFDGQLIAGSVVKPFSKMKYELLQTTFIVLFFFLILQMSIVNIQEMAWSIIWSYLALISKPHVLKLKSKMFPTKQPCYPEGFTLDAAGMIFDSQEICTKCLVV